MGVIYPAGTPTAVRLAAWVATGLLVVTVIGAVVAWHRRKPALIYIAGAVWAIGSPLWFWFEYFYLYLPRGNLAAAEHYKQGHQVSATIWAGVSLALFALASADRFKQRQ